MTRTEILLDIPHHPLLCNEMVVQNILAGRQTQDRRPVEMSPEDWEHLKSYEGICIEPRDVPKGYQIFTWDQWYDGEILLKDVGRWVYQWDIKSPFGLPGDLLWVRETWMVGPNAHNGLDPYKYRASVSEQFKSEWPKCWKPSIHMPKEAARIWLIVKKVWVHRLQEITTEDIMAEGIEALKAASISQLNRESLYRDYSKKEEVFSDGVMPRASFSSLWDSIYSKGSAAWDQNPWVWACEYEVISTTGIPDLSVIAEKRNQIIK